MAVRTPLRPHRLYSVSFLFILILIILILPLNILFIDSAGRSSDALLNQAEYTLGSISSVYINQIDARLKRTSVYLDDIMTNDANFQTVLKQSGDEYYKLSKYMLAQKLIDNSSQQNYGDLYFLFSPKLDDLMLLKPVTLTNLNMQAFSEYIHHHAEKTHSTSWNLIEVDDEPYLIRSSYRSGMYIGSLLRLSGIRDAIAERLDYATASVAFSALPDNSTDEDTFLTVTAASEEAGLFIIIRIETQEALKHLSVFQRYSLWIALFYLLLIPLLLLALGILLLRPLRSILNALNQLKEGRQEYRLPVETRIFNTKEFHGIAVAFNRMADSIHKLTIENYEQQLARQQVELDNLQLTIRPHFLQNTFGILFTLCQMGENDQLGHFILYLSSYFRYIYQGLHQLTPFRQELEIIRGYIEIARVQHPDSFEISYEISEGLSDICVPPLLVHNFIENIMSHALKHGTYLHILLRLEKEKDQAVFTVADDGIGMSAEAVAAVNRGEAVRDDGRIHVGLYNSFQRLEKIYHGRARMHVASSPGSGTSVEIRIPLAPDQNASDDSEKETCYDPVSRK